MADASQTGATLIISRGPGAGGRFDIGAAPVTIGRQAQCDIQIEDTWMSRRHARLAWTGTSYIVEDLGSTNGTFVNDQRVSGPHALRSGDRLRLGDQVELAFHVGVSAPAHEEPVSPGAAPYPVSSALPPQAQATPPEAKRKRVWVWALGLLGLILVLAAAGIVYILLPEQEQWVVFASTQSDSDDDDTSETNIFIMRPDGSEMSQVTSYSGSDWSPVLSPDGQTVLFVSDRDGESGIYRVQVDGTELNRLTPTDSSQGDPSWSPDGDKIAFVSNQDNEGPEIYTMNTDGGDITRLTDHEFGCRDPEWSPNGKLIAYSCFSTEGGYDIYVMNADGSDSRRITEGIDFDVEPSWSPDGKRIAYSRWYMGDVEEDRGFDVLTATNSRKLILLYTGSSFGIEFLNSAIHTMAADGSENRELAVTEDSSNWSPVWSHDGETILFASDRDGDADIYTITLDSLEITNITNSEDNDYTPHW